MDLSDKKLAKDKVAQIKHTLQTPGWNVIKNITEGYIHGFEKMIIGKRQASGEEATDAQVEVYREVREFMVDFLAMPENTIEELDPTPPTEENLDHLDPYATQEDIDNKK